MAAKSLRKIVFDKIQTKEYKDDKAMTIAEAKKIIGWHGEKDPDQKELFGDNFLFKDQEGVKVRLDNNDTNRPFRRGLALTYANEHLRGKWKFNGNRLVFDLRNNCQSGQHTICGFIMAEQIRKKNPKMWSEEYSVRGELTMEIGCIWGISDAPEVVDTIDIGQKRSLADVIFRNRQFEKYTEKEQVTLARILGGAVRVVWLCTGGQTVASAPKLLHSVGLDLIEDHPKLLDCVAFVFAEEGEKQISNYISLAYAAGLMYLMGTCKTNSAKYDEEGSAALDTSLMEALPANEKQKPRAEKFWQLFASGGDEVKKGHPVFTLKTFLTSASASGGHERDEIIAAVKLAWNAYLDGKTLEGVKDLKPGYETDKKTEKKVLLMPYMGGLDVKKEMPVPPPKPPKAPKAPKAAKTGGRGPGPGKKVKKNTKTTSYPFKEGDEVHVLPNGIDSETKKAYEAYVARVSSIEDDGKVKVVPKGTKFECTLDPTTGDYVGLEAAPEVVA